MGSNTLTRQGVTEQDHPVLEAIADFRETLNRMIDEQQALLADRSTASEAASHRAVVKEPVFAPSVSAVQSEDHAPQFGNEPKSSRTASATPTPTQTPTPPSPPTPTPKLKPTPPTLERTFEPIQESNTSGSDEDALPAEKRDSRQRLDALARLLDKRAKQPSPNPAPLLSRQIDK